MYAPNLKTLIDPESSPMHDVLVWFHADEQGLSRRYPIVFSPAACQAFAIFYDEWGAELDAIAFDDLSVAGRVDFHLLKQRISKGRRWRNQEQRRYEESKAWLPFAEAVIELEERRLAIEPVDPETAAGHLNDACKATKTVLETLMASGKNAGLDPAAANAVVGCAGTLKAQIENWFKERNGYDPLVSWWVENPYRELIDTLDAYVKVLKTEVLGEKEGSIPPIASAPLGRAFIVSALRDEAIAYSPEALIDIAEQELTWCEAEADRAAAELGYSENRAGAIEHIKTLHVQPGEQPYQGRALAEEAVAFLDDNGLISIPEHARRIWRQTMIPPETQASYPFLWGGETMGMSFAHSAMSHTQKLSSMRSNNIPFLRATVHHELIPGHHLQMYKQARCNVHRHGYGTAFCGEGWPLYWELLLFEMGFPKTPADRLGFLFWRLHRCARVMVVLGFHIGRYTISDCLDLVIGRVGHELEGGTSQVRWLTGGGPEPLYGAAYMLGGLQLRALRRELVDGGVMTERAFHDAVLEANSMPIELLRALLTRTPPARDDKPAWHFYRKQTDESTAGH